MKTPIVAAAALFFLVPAQSVAQLSRLVVLYDLEEEEGVVEISSPESRLGTNVTRAGDVDRDGLDDILLAATERSEVILLHGQPGLPAKLDPYSGAARMSVMTANPFERWSIEAGGGADVNGDGIDDFFVSEAGVTTVVFGSRSLPGAFALDDVGGSVPGVRLGFPRAVTQDDYFRSSASLGSDVNGDGIGEILLGDPDWGGAESGRGRVHVVFGGQSLPAAIDLDDVGGSIPGLVVEGVRPDIAGTDGDGIGFCVQTAGDLDGDGLGDLGISGSSCAGGSYIVYGRTEFPPRIRVDEIPGAFGAFLEGVSGCMRSMGDLDGDGRGEVTVQYGGESFALPTQCPCDPSPYHVVILAGRDRAFLGPFQLSEEIVTDPRNTVIRDRGPSFGLCPAVMPIDAGRDVDGDGRADLLFAREAVTQLLPEGTVDTDITGGPNGLIYAFTTAADLPREVNVREGRWGFQIAGKIDDHLGYGVFGAVLLPGGPRLQPLPLVMGLLSDFDGDGRGDLLLGAPSGRVESRAYVVPFRALEDPRLEIKAVSPGTGLASGGDQVRISGRGLAPGTNFFFGGVEAEVVSAPNQREVVVRVPPWQGGPLEVAVSAVRGARRSDFPAAFRYADVSVIEAEDLSLGLVAGGELFTELRDIGSDGPVLIEQVEVVHDVNGDGIDEITIQTDNGTALVYGGPHLDGRTDFYRTPHGLGLPLRGELLGLVEDPTIGRITGSGDVDGDGIGDFAIWTHGNGSWLHIVYGGSDLPRDTHPAAFPRRTRIAATLGYNDNGIVQDLDGHDHADFVMTAYDPELQICRLDGANFGVWIVHGEDLQGIRDADWGDVPKLLLRTRFERIDTYESLDANGDGRADLAIQVKACGREGLLVLFGGEHLAGTGEILVDDAFLDGGRRGLVAMGRRYPEGYPSLGFVLSRAGDVDGDGDEELLAGSPFIDGIVGGTELREPGEAYLLSLRRDAAPPPDSEEARDFAARFGVTPFTVLDPGQPRPGVLAMQGESAFRRIGHGVAGAGDLNGDGVPDLAVGQGTFVLTDCGRCSGVFNEGVPYTFVFFGEKGLLDGRVSLLGPEASDVGFLVRGAGYRVAGGGDVNGDGYADLVTARFGGKAYILFGGPGLGEIRFRRGDADLSGRIEISDAIRTLGHLFLGTAPLRCLDAADIDDDGKVEITDPIRLLDHLFLGGPAPLPPFPEPGTDPTTDSLECSDV